jgi:hypothetical protein
VEGRREDSAAVRGYRKVILHFEQVITRILKTAEISLRPGRDSSTPLQLKLDVKADEHRVFDALNLPSSVFAPPTKCLSFGSMPAPITAYWLGPATMPTSLVQQFELIA